MKRLILGITICILVSSTNAMAMNIFADGFGTMLGSDDSQYHLGGGVTVGFELTREFNIIYRGIFTSKTVTAATSDSNPASRNLYEREYSHMANMAGLEYMFEFPQFHLVWRSSALLGFSTSSNNFTKHPSLADEEVEDLGLCMAIFTGVQFNATQHISPFLELGYHHSFYSGDLKGDVFGLVINVGLRFYLWNNVDAAENY